jgi:hypothetical protein
MYIRMYFEVAYQLMFLGELRIAEVKAVLYNSNPKYEGCFATWVWIAGPQFRCTQKHCTESWNRAG